MYMSPEQASGNVETIGPGCDIYSLGVIMYELLTGRVPFEGPEAFVLGQIFFVEPRPPSTYRADLDPRLEAICLKSIAKSLDRRYATVGELAMALGDYLRSADGAPRVIDVRRSGVTHVASRWRPDDALEIAAESSPRPAASPPRSSPLARSCPSRCPNQGPSGRPGASGQRSSNTSPCDGPLARLIKPHMKNYIRC